MRGARLAVVVLLIVGGALLFALWPSKPDAFEPGPETRAPAAAAATPVVPSAPARPTTPAPTVAPSAPSPERAPLPSMLAAAPNDVPALDSEPDPEHLRALGLDPEKDVEPLDGGVLHPLNRDGIKAAMNEALPEISNCYEAWLEQSPKLAGSMKVEFRIVEIPGRDRAKVVEVTIPDGGLGHVAMEGCVGNVVSGLRFESPKGGEMRVSYPFSFSTSETETPHP